MKKGLRRNCRRFTAGFLALSMTAILTLGDAGAVLAVEGQELLAQLTGKNDSDFEIATSSDADIRERRADVVMNVIADEESEFSSGSTVVLNVNIKNNTDEVIENGALAFWANGVAEDSAYLELPDEDSELELSEGFVLTNDLEGESGSGYSYATPSDAEEWAEEEDVVSQTVEGIRLNPGQTYTGSLYFDIEEEVSGAKRQSVKFRFQGQGETKKVRTEDSFDYVVNGMNLDEIVFEDENRVMAGDVVTMAVHSALYEESADGDITAEELHDLMLATPSNMKATPSDAAAVSGAGSAAKATMSNAETNETESFVEFQAGGASYEIEIYNLGIHDFNVEKALNNGDTEKMLLLSFETAEDAEPGTYYGKITQKAVVKGVTSRSTQGFVLVVEPDGEVKLESSVKNSDARVTVSGPASSFPEADQLVVAAREISMDDITDAELSEQIREAVEKKSQEENIDIESFKAMDVRLYADGEEVHELPGSIQVQFHNVNTDDTPDNTSEVMEISAISTFGMRKMAAQNTAEASETENDGAEPETNKAEAAEAAGAETGNTASENEAGSPVIQVWHLDEESQEISTMETAVDAAGNVVMTTDHFSIYIWVDLGLGKPIATIQVTVEHWARNLVTINGTANAANKTDTVFNKSNKTVRTKTTTPQIYSTDVFTVPNQYYDSIESLSKLLNVKGGANWSVYSVKINGKEYFRRSDGKYFTNAAFAGNEVTEIKLEADSKIEFYYNASSAEKSYDVVFYDHNITDGHRYNKNGVRNDASGLYLKSNAQQMNANASFASTKTTNRMGSGQPASGNRSSWAPTATYNNRFLNKGNDADGDGIVKNIVTGLNNGNLVFNSGVNPSKYFFTPSGTISRRYNGNLVFKRTGDTYVLSKVTGSNGVGATGLETIKGYADDAVYSNNFWPLDGVSYTGKDPNMGGSTIYIDYDTRNAASPNKFGASDDGKAHNWHFGMTYSVDFTVGDYIGPMEYYFRGDDDFWLFIDGKLAIDIGGVHIAAGETLDVKQFLRNQGDYPASGDNLTEAQKNKKHTMTIYYMERGGFGSCCYMHFTLPNSEPVPIPEIPLTKYTVKKVWDDRNNPYRPSSIEVELYQNDVATGEKVTLSASNNWTHTWTELPKQHGKDKTEYVYTVKETAVPSHYTSLLNGGTLTNTLKETTKVKVVKKWEDAPANHPESITVTLYADEVVYKDGTGMAYTATLKGDNNWSAEWDKLPKYDSNNKPITYTVKETVPSQYTASYDDSKTESGYDVFVTITNTYAHTDISVHKEWKGATEDQKSDVNVALYNVQGQSKFLINGSEQTLNAANKWSYKWTDLPQYDKDGQEIKYQPFELDDQGNPVDGGASIQNGKFIVTYKDENGNRQITNTYNYTSITVVKEWVDYDNTYGSRPQDLNVQLLQDGKSYGEPEALNEANAWKYTWENIPIKAKADAKDYVYTVAEIDESDTPKQIHDGEEGIFNNYVYKAAYDMNTNTADGTEEKLFKITNTIKPAVLRLSKQVVDNGESSEENPFLPKYKFLIRLKNTDTGEIYTTVALGHQETSGDITLILPHDGTGFTVDEIVPMEYEVDEYRVEWNAGSGTADTADQKAAFTIKPGDDITVTVVNKPTHEGYFHHTTSVTNEYKMSGGRFEPADQYSEEPNSEKTDGGGQASKQLSMALIPEKSKRDDEEDGLKLSEEGDELYG